MLARDGLVGDTLARLDIILGRLLGEEIGYSWLKREKILIAKDTKKIMYTDARSVDTHFD